jgi:hypothetical protein
MTNLDRTISQLFDAVERVMKSKPQPHKLSPEGQRNLEACQRILRRVGKKAEVDYTIMDKVRDEAVGG